jgi:hypothetical protein
MGVVGRRRLRAGAGEVDGQVVAVLHQRHHARPDETLVHPHRVGKGDAAVLPVGPGLDPLAGSLLGDLEHLAEQADDGVDALPLAHLHHPGPHPVGGGAAGLEVDGHHLRRPDPEGLEDVEDVLPQFEILTDLRRRQVEALLEAGRGRDRHAAGFRRPGLGGVDQRRRPGDELALEEDRHGHHLVGVVDAAVDGVVGEPQVAVLHAGVLGVVGQDVLDDEGRDDGVEVAAAGAVDHVAVGGEDPHQRVAGDPHGGAAGTDEDVHPLVEDVVGPLEADLELPEADLLHALELVVGGRHRLQPVKLLLQRGDAAHDALPPAVASASASIFWLWVETGAASDSSTPRPYRSMEYRIPGGTTIVVKGASTTAGPAMTLPGRSESASYSAVSTQSRVSGQ